MRLTPSWFRSSSPDTTEEQSVDGNDSLDVPIYHTPDGTHTAGDPEESDPAVFDDRPADAFIPDSDAALRAVLENLSTPVTIDELVDELISRTDPPPSSTPVTVSSGKLPEPPESLETGHSTESSRSSATANASPTDGPPVPVETWAVIHEHLHQDRLPHLDDDDVLEFDPASGTVDNVETASRTRAIRQRIGLSTLMGVVSVALLFVLAAFVTASMYTAVTVTVAATTFAVWFLPAYGVV